MGSLLIVLILLLIRPCAGVASARRPEVQRPLDVYVLAGQSNMVGMGSIEHLDLLVRETGGTGTGTGTETGITPATAKTTNEFRQRLVDFNRTNATSIVYKSLDNVFLTFNGVHGPLTVARRSGFAAPNCFGPELLIGWTLHELDPSATILLIKTAWGGKSLGIDFRPPSAGIGNFSSDIRPMQYGQYYRAMVQEVTNVLANVSAYVPDNSYNHSRGYQLSGLFWLQGWNDLISWPLVDEYGRNLVHFIRDVQRDLSAPLLPVVIGELGQHGVDLDPHARGTSRVVALRAQQHAVTMLPEFRYTTHFVRTAPYVVTNGTQYNGQYHYGGRADTFYRIGQALGHALQRQLRLRPHPVRDD